MSSNDTQESHFPLFRAWLWGPFRVEKWVGESYEVVQTADWGGSNYPRLLLKALLCCPGRQARREALLEMLWPEADFEQASASLNTATSKLRRLLRQAMGQASWLATGDDFTLYALPAQALFWTDVDRAQEALAAAEQHGRTSAEALPWLEEAVTIFQRGSFLDGEEGQWATGKRATRERESYRAQLWLAETYTQQGMVGRAEHVLTALLEHDPFDEDVLCRLMTLLHAQGMTHQALVLYRQMQDFFTQERMKLSEATNQLAARMEKERPIPPLISFLEKDATERFRDKRDLVEGQAFPPSLPIIKQRGAFLDRQPFEDLSLLKQSVGELNVNYSRRQMLQGILAAACTTLTLSPYKLLQPEKQERLLASVQNPLYLNEAVLDDFSEIIRRYWKLSANASSQLLNGLFGLFQDITQILNTSQTPALTERLYSLSSEVAQLLGKTLFDLHDYPLAFSYYGFALKAALEAHNYDLWATSLGRMALLLLSSDQPQQALTLLEGAQGAPIKSLKIGSWHAAIEAEAYSYLGNSSFCGKALERAKDTSEATFLEADIYATGFTRARLASYEGSCYLRLSQPERALAVLEQAMQLIDPASVRRLSRLLTYLGETHFLLGHERQACEYAFQALDLTCQTQSLDILRRVRKLRDSLLTEGETSYAKDLERHIEETWAVITKAGELYG